MHTTHGKLGPAWHMNPCRGVMLAGHVGNELSPQCQRPSLLDMTHVAPLGAPDVPPFPAPPPPREPSAPPDGDPAVPAPPDPAEPPVLLPSPVVFPPQDAATARAAKTPTTFSRRPVLARRTNPVNVTSASVDVFILPTLPRARPTPPTSRRPVSPLRVGCARGNPKVLHIAPYDPATHTSSFSLPQAA
jgi:hypothetical protein